MASGILNLNKAPGPTSFAVVRALKRLPGVRKVGHGGTLDPAADGVLPVLINAATRVAEFVHDWPKTYLATVRLGAVSDTGDSEGTISRIGDPRAITADQIEAVLPRFVGEIRQVPPAYSALKQSGESLYRKARRGEAISVSARTVRIDALTLLAYEPSAAAARLEVRAGRGMYVRSLARDLGEALGCGAYLSGLTRTAVGPLELSSAITAEQLIAMGPEWTTALLPMDLPLQSWPAVHLDPTAAEAVRRGRGIPAPESAVARYRLLDEAGQLIGWGVVEGQRLQPRAVFEP